MVGQAAEGRGAEASAAYTLDIALERRALEIFDEALLQPLWAQAEWIANACAEDLGLLSAVEGLRRAAELSALLPTQLPDAQPLSASAPPDQVGVFRLTGLVGRGGMGEVWRAERVDGLFEQVVAVKILRPSLFAHAARELFEEERRVLARLRHPNIAQLFDGGVCEDGTPYFVMELIEGAAIDEALGAAEPRQIARQMIDVCAGVQHAHSHLVAHADIKPSNIIIAENGAAKLLDFGIAKVFGEARAAGAGPLTPGYASPQRMAGEPAAPSDDIFSLGVVLYELLTRSRRGSEETLPLTPGRAAPSAVGKGAPKIPADLVAIVRCATDPRPAQRYSSASAMAADLSAWLEQRPVKARQGDWRYASSRFLLRHRWGVSATVLVIVTLIGALATTGVLFEKAETQRAAAVERFDEVRSLAKYQLFDLYDDLASTPGTAVVRYQLARTAQGYLDRLSRTQGVTHAVRIETAEGYARLAEILGVPGRPNLGDAAGARRNLEMAELQLADLSEPAANVARARIEVARAAMQIWTDQTPNAALANLDRADALLASRPQTANAREVQLSSRLRRMEVLDWGEQFRSLEQLAAETLASLDAWPVSERAGGAYTAAWAQARTKQGDALWYLGDHDGARQAYLEARRRLVVAAQDHANDPDLLLMQMRVDYAYATALEGEGVNPKQIHYLREALDIGARLLPAHARDENVRRIVRQNQAALSEALADAGRFKEAFAIMRERIDADRQIHLASPHETLPQRDLAWSLSAYGGVLWRGGEGKGACEAWGESARLFDELAERKTLTSWDAKTQVPRLRDALARCGP